MNQFNDLHGKEPNKTPRNWNSKPPEAQFKSRTSTPKKSPMVSDITGKMNNHAIDNGDAEVHTSECPVEFNSESITDTDTTPIKPIDNYDMDHLLELFHHENICCCC